MNAFRAGALIRQRGRLGCSNCNGNCVGCAGRLSGWRIRRLGDDSGSVDNFGLSDTSDNSSFDPSGASTIDWTSFDAGSGSGSADPGTSDTGLFNSNGVIDLGDGSVIEGDGTMVFPDGSSIEPDGTQVAPNGDATFPDGSKLLADGTFINADGTVDDPNATSGGAPSSGKQSASSGGGSSGGGGSAGSPKGGGGSGSGQQPKPTQTTTQQALCLLNPNLPNCRTAAPVRTAAASPSIFSAAWVQQNIGWLVALVVIPPVLYGLHGGR